jgi:uncharacterized protein (TIGR02246 family)
MGLTVFLTQWRQAPHTRVQRTRSSPSAHRLPLTRHSSGGQAVASPSRSQVFRLLSSAALSLAALVGCNGPKAPPSATKADVERATVAFHEALRTNDAETFLSFVADDVVMMPPGEAPVRGKDALRAWYAVFLSQYRTSSLTLGDREVFVGEGFAVEIGSFEWGLTPAAGGTPILDRGNYMQVWRRQPDGQWRFEREIWNSSAPAVK